MSEMTSRPEIAGWFYRLLEEHDISASVSCVVKTGELIKVARTFPWPPHIIESWRAENPFYFAFKAIITGLAQMQERLGIFEPVDFIFDDQSESEQCRAAWDLLKISVTPELRNLMGEKPLFLDDKRYKPLQAADLFAWWVRKWKSEGNEEAIKRLKFPWGAKKHIRQLHMIFEEEDFQVEFNKTTLPDSIARAQISDPAVTLSEIEKRETGIKMTLPDPTSRLRF